MKPSTSQTAMADKASASGSASEPVAKETRSAAKPAKPSILKDGALTEYAYALGYDLTWKRYKALPEDEKKGVDFNLDARLIELYERDKEPEVEDICYFE